MVAIAFFLVDKQLFIENDAKFKVFPDPTLSKIQPLDKTTQGCFFFSFQFVTNLYLHSNKKKHPFRDLPLVVCEKMQNIFILR